jgi:hypothetical protein
MKNLIICVLVIFSISNFVVNSTSSKTLTYEDLYDLNDSTILLKKDFEVKSIFNTSHESERSFYRKNEDGIFLVKKDTIMVSHSEFQF